MSQKRDYYEVLGVPQNASLNQIKKAYRSSALKYHPDRNKGNRDAEVKFKETTEAYEVLRDEKKRNLYDQFGHAGVSGSASQGNGFGHTAYTDFSDIFSGSSFEDLFENFFSRGFSSGNRRRESRRGADLRYNLEIDLEDVYYGKEINIRIPRDEHCSDCKGTGSKDGKETVCYVCKGSGQIRKSSGFFSIATTCTECRGSGHIIASPCYTCNGSGLVHRKKTLNVRIPKGVESGTRLKITGEGEAGPAGIPSGDLYVVLQIKRHPDFGRDGITLLTEADIPVTTAILGGEVDVKTLTDSHVKLKIPPGTQPDTSFRLRNKGLPMMSSPSRYGDILVKVNLVIPKSLSTKARKLAKELEQELQHSSGIFSRFRV